MARLSGLAALDRQLRRDLEAAGLGRSLDGLRQIDPTYVYEYVAARLRPAGQTPPPEGRAIAAALYGQLMDQFDTFRVMLGEELGRRMARPGGGADPEIASLRIARENGLRLIGGTGEAAAVVERALTEPGRGESRGRGPRMG